MDQDRYSKTCVKLPLKNRQKKILMTNGSSMKVESIAEFCNTFDLHLAIISPKNQLSVFLRVAILHRFYCTCLYRTTFTNFIIGLIIALKN